MNIEKFHLPKVVVAGAFQNGKSTLINCLLDDKYAPMGNGLRTTSCCSHFYYGEAEVAKLINEKTVKSKILDRREDVFSAGFQHNAEEHLEFSCWKPLLQKVILIDTPGFDANCKDDSIAESAIKNADVVIFVHQAMQLGEEAEGILRKIRDNGKHLLFLFNCTTKSPLLRWGPSHEGNHSICQTVESQLVSMGLENLLIEVIGQKVWPCNPVFAWYALGHLQRDLDSINETIRTEAEDLISDVNSFCQKRKIQKENRKIFLLKESGILEIRRAVERVAVTLLESMCKNPATELKRLTDAWHARIRAIVKAEKDKMSR